MSRALAALAGALIAAALACFLTAIWTVGPDSARWAGTGFLALVVGGWVCVSAYLTSAFRDRSHQ